MSSSIFFLLMVLLSVYHAFYLGPRLAQALTSSEEVVVGTPGQALVGVAHASAARTAQATNNAPGTDDMAGDRDEEEVSERAQHLVERLEGWLRREAMLGVAVLFCVALLGAFAGTLAPPLSSVPCSQVGHVTRIYIDPARPGQPGREEGRYT